MPTKPARDVLLEKARAHFIEHGVGDTSLRSLAAEIGTSHRMLIYHFQSREGLLTELVSHIWESQRQLLGEQADAVPENPRDAAWGFWSVLADANSITPLIFEMSAPAMQGAPWAESFREGAAMWVAVLSERLVGFGVDPERAELVARMGINVVRGALWEYALTNDRDVADATVWAFLETVWPADG